MPIIWCGLARNATLLAECGPREPAVDKLAKSILAKKPTAGWEFASAGKLQAVKLHVYESKTLVWSCSCVHDHDASVAKGFLEKVLLMTEPLRSDWQEAAALSQQDAVGPMLQQRMEQANSLGRVAMVTDRVNEVKGIMNDNIAVLLENTAKVEHLEGQSVALMESASVFKKASKSLKSFYLWQNAKFGAAAGSAVTAGVAIVTVPPLAAACGTGVGLGVGLGIATTAGVATGVATTYTKNKKSEAAAAASSGVHLS